MNIYYLAGLFDGEGTITLTKRKSTDIYRTPTLSLTSTTKILCELIKQEFGGWIVTKKTYKDHHKPAWSWHINGDKAVNSCAALVEYINEPQKKARMMLIINFYKSVTPRNGKYSDQAKLYKEQFEEKFFSL